MKKPTILIVDDTPSSLFKIKIHIEEWGYIALTASGGQEALDILSTTPVDLIISDQVMPGMDGIALLLAVRELYEDIPFIMLTAHGSIDKAVISIRQGADDYVEKPYHKEEFGQIIRRSLDYARTKIDNKRLKEFVSEQYGFHKIISQSSQMRKAIRLAAKVAESPATTVALYGESGTGKELFAHAIHFASGCTGKFVGLNCAGVPQGLLESELFGHLKGAFTGADADREGKLGLAGNGTLLLDEIGDMPFDLQSKILRFLQERSYEKLGSDKLVRADVRIIVSTNKNLESLIKAGKFREDLFHRINAFPIVLPPLRERKNDIPLLADHFTKQYRKELGKAIPGISQAAMETLSEYDWPGNVRELKNCIERAVILTQGELIRPGHLNIRREKPNALSFVEDNGNIRLCFEASRENFSMDAMTDHVLQLVLNQCGGNKSRASDILKVNRKMFYRLQNSDSKPD